MQTLPIVLAFIGGGVAEALVAFVAHHLHSQPVKVEIVNLTPGVQRALIEQPCRPDWQRGVEHGGAW